MTSDFFNAINTVVHVMHRNQIKILPEMEVAKPHNLLREVVEKGIFYGPADRRGGEGRGVSSLGPDRKQM